MEEAVGACGRLVARVIVALALGAAWSSDASAAGAGGGGGSAARQLEGLWTSSSLTMMERPSDFRTLTVPDTEARAFELARNKRFLEGPSDDIGSLESEVQTWEKNRRLARIGGQARTSWLVDPTDGHLPYSSAGKAIVAARKAAASSDNPEQRGGSERCLQATWGQAAPPMMNGPYSNLYQIVETADAVVISLEDNHEVRIVRLRQKEHLPRDVRPWMGDSIGHWEGRTLVVETTNFNQGDALKAQANVFISEGARVTERFTRTGPHELLYRFEVDDPAIYTRPWHGEMAYVTAKGPVFEFACHEGNYSLAGILAGARHEESSR